MKTQPIATILIGLTTSLFALEDTPNNRAKLADRLMQSFPLQDFWAPAQRKLDASPRNQREFIVALLRHMDWNAVGQAVRRSVIEIYTANEIQALIDAYASPVGRSILRKGGLNLSAEESSAARRFFGTPIGQSIKRKSQIFNSRMQPILKNELAKAAIKLSDEYKDTQ